MKVVLRTLVICLIAAVALWRWCFEPLRYEIRLGRLEADTVAAAETADDRSVLIARTTLQSIRRYAARFPADVRLAMLEGANARFAGDDRAAVTAYERALLYDRRPEIYLNLALAERQLGLQNEAASNLAQAIRFNPVMARDADEPLRRKAIALIRGTEAVPLCCAASYEADQQMQLLSVQGSHIPTITPRGRPLVEKPWTPQFAWSEGSIVNVVGTGTAAETEWLRFRRPVSGPAFMTSQTPAVGDGWRIAGAGNFLGDGSTSLLLSNRVTGEARVWKLAPGGVEETAAPSLVAENSYIAGCADFDADGRIDAVYRTSTGDDFIELLVNTTLIAKFPLPPAGFQRELVAAADFDGDHQPDLLWYDFESRRAILWVMRNKTVEKVLWWPQQPR